jgi:pimeloyl-ACP methyl ester carboxylesterase
MLQWVNTRRFRMFDYGTTALNLAAYGTPTPLDIASEYWRIDVPVDFAAGKHDGIISPACVKKHWAHMLACGVPHVTYREFDFGHLDFTFSAKQDLRHHVISCIE